MANWLASLFAKDKVAGLADQVLVSGGGFLTIAICAHALSLAEQGEFTYLLASYMALLLLNVASVFQGAAVRAPSQNHTAYKTSLARLQLLQAFALSTLVGGLWLTADSVLNLQVTSADIALIFAFLVLQQLSDFSRRSAYVFASASRALFYSAMLYPIRIISLIIIQPHTLHNVLLILVASAILPATITVFNAFSMKIEARAWYHSVTAHLAYSRLFILGAPLGWLWSYMPILILGFMNGKEQAAILGSMRGISNIANVLMEQLETQVVAEWARIHNTEGKSGLEGAVYRLTKIGIVLWLLGLATIILFGQEIVNLLLGILYKPYWKLLVISWLAYGLYFLARIYGISHRTIGANHVEFGGGVFAVVTALVTGFVFITYFGLSGAAWSYVVISGALLVAQIYQVKKLNR